LLLAFYLVFTLAPILWLFISTIQTQASLLRVPAHLLPESDYVSELCRHLSTSGPGQNTGESTFLLALRNSVIVSLGTTVVAVGFWHFGGLCHRPTQHTSKANVVACGAWLTVVTRDLNRHA